MNYLVSLFIFWAWIPIYSSFTNTGTFCIQEDSRLYLNGTSNVTDFSCICENEFGSYVFQYQMKGEGKYVQFLQTNLTFPSKTLDCGRRAINKDMFETLKADVHPEIEIQIKEVWPSTGNTLQFSGKQWSLLRVKTQLTIANEARIVWMDIKGKAISEGRYHFKGHQDLLLTSFCLEPPNPLAGLIKVDDCVTIFFDLLVEVSV